MDLIVYDVELCEEVKKREDWKKINQDWFGCATVYSYVKNQYFFFLHQNQLPALKNFLHNNFTISFNGVNFDSKVILGRERIVSIYNGWSTGMLIKNNAIKWIEYDLFTQCLKGIFNSKDDLEASKRISPGGCKLTDIADATLRIRKMGDSAKVPLLYKQKRYGELLAHNLQDVRVTKALFEHVIKHGSLRNGKGQKIVLERRGEWFTSC
ncbi:hypothetical protein LCGC14_1702840, partial [marine sediment metagenome]